MKARPTTQVPDFPGKVNRAAPAPPKYLVATASNGETVKLVPGETVKHAQNKVSPSILPSRPSRGPVDSKYDVKATAGSCLGNIAGTDVDPLTSIPKYVDAAPPKLACLPTGYITSSSAFERSKLANGSGNIMGGDSGVTFERANNRLARYVAPIKIQEVHSIMTIFAA